MVEQLDDDAISLPPLQVILDHLMHAIDAGATDCAGEIASEPLDSTSTFVQDYTNKGYLGK